MGIRGRIVAGLGNAATYGSAASVGGPWAAGTAAVAGLAQGLFSRTPGERQRSAMRREERRSRRAGNVQQSGSVSASPLPDQSGNPITGYNAESLQYDRNSPEQVASRNQLLPGITQSLQNPIDFEAINRETRRQYDQEILPGISNRFTRNTGGKPSSPDFAAQVHAGGIDLQTRLDAQRANFELKRREQDQSLFHTLMNPTQENVNRPGTPGLLADVGSKVLENLPDIISKGADVWNKLFPEKKVEPGYHLTPDQARLLLRKLQGKQASRTLTPDEQTLLSTQTARNAGQPNYRGGPNYNIGTAGQASSLPQQSQRTMTPDENILAATQQARIQQTANHYIQKAAPSVQSTVMGNSAVQPSLNNYLREARGA